MYTQSLQLPNIPLLSLSTAGRRTEEVEVQE